MLALKNDVTRIFEKIQYESEKLVDRLDKINYQSESREFKRVLIKYINEKLRRTKKTLLDSNNEEDLMKSLELVEKDYDQLTTNINQQIDRLENDEDVSDYIYQLKKETSDVLSITKEKLKRLF